MRGDIMFCLHCKHFFFDIHVIHDTRTERKFLDLCPYCLGTKSVNASYYMGTGKHSHSYPYQLIKEELNKNRKIKNELWRRWNNVT